MLMTHVRPNELLGKKVFDRDGRLVGEVVGIASRHGRLHAVVLRNGSKVHRLPERTRTPERTQTPRLRVLH